MPVIVDCSECGKRYRLPDSAAGRRAKCKACGAMISVPSAAPAEVDDAFSAMAELESAPKPAPVARATPIARPVSAGRTAPVTPAAPPADPSWQSAPVPLLAPLPRVDAPVGGASPYFIQPPVRVEVREKGSSSLGLIVRIVVWGFVALLVAIVVAAMSRAGAGMLAIALIGALMMLAGYLWYIGLILSEGLGTVLCCIFIPFYGLYFALSRLDRTWKPMACVFSGLAIMLLGRSLYTPPNRAAASNSGNGNNTAQVVQGQEPASAGVTVATGSSNYAGRSSGSTYTPPPADPAAEAVKAARAQVQSFIHQDRSDSSRERAAQELEQLKATLARDRQSAAATDARAASRINSLWSPVEMDLREAELAVAKLPSESVDPQIFKDPTNATYNWTVRAAAASEEVSFRNLRLRPPTKALLDLTSSEQDEQRGVAWAQESEATLAIRQVRKSNARQRQPWLISRAFLTSLAERDHLLAIDTRESSVTVGTISGIPFWRVTPRQGGGAIRYIASVGTDWLMADITASSATSAVAAEFENAVRSLRPAQAADTRVDPFSPERIAPRLADKPDEALALLQRYGPKAEAVVLPLLSGADPRAARAAATFLATHGTTAAIPQLRKAADSSDAELAAAARAALRRLTPTDFDTLAEVLLDLKAKEGSRRNEAARRLAAMQPDAARRVQVATLLEEMILAEAGEVDRDVAAAALEQWFTDKTVARLLPVLSKEDTDPARRDAAMRVVSATGNKTAASAIIRWLIKEPEKTIAALIKMGPAAEDATVKVYNARTFGREQEDLTVRANCVRILSEVGMTAQALQTLTRASKDARDAATQIAAKTGIESVKARMATAKPTTQPAPAKS